MEREIEQELVKQLQDGSQKAYQQLLRHHLPSISHYAYRMTGNTADAEDVAQEVFVRLWQKAKKYDPAKARLSTWLHQVAHNLSIDLHRKATPTEEIENHELPGTEYVDQDLEAEEKQQRLDAALQILPERQRSAIVMCHYQGLSNRDAANVLDVSVDALESLLARARRTLKSRLLEGQE